MIVTLCEYKPTASAKKTYKLCVKSSLSNLVFESDYGIKIDGMIRKLGIQLSTAYDYSIKYHRDYNGTLECTQTIFYIKEV